MQQLKTEKKRTEAGYKKLGGTEMGAGVVMMAGGIVGMVVCMILLCILPGIFEKQRKKLLSEIENEI